MSNPETTALAVIETMSPAEIFVPGALDGIITRISEEVREQARSLDISTMTGRSDIASLAYKVARSKTFIDTQRKILVGEEKKRLAKIDQEGKRIWDALEALQLEVRKPLTDYENAEKLRIYAHETAISDIAAVGEYTSLQWMSLPVETMQERLAEVTGDAKRDWQEFTSRAEAALIICRNQFETAISKRQKYDQEQEELQQLRKAAVEREQVEREARIAREATEKAEKAAAERELRAILDKEDAEKRAAAAIRAAENATLVANQQAKARAATKKAADEAEKMRREESTRIRNRVHAEIVKALQVSGGLSPKEAADLTVIISEGKIPHVSIKY